MIWFKTKGEALAAANAQLVVARDIDRSGRKEYSYVADVQALSAAIGRESPCMYEVVTGAWREMYDFDGKDLEVSEDEIIRSFLQCRHRLSQERVMVKSASVPGKLSLHFVLPDVTLAHYKEMRSRFDQLIQMQLPYANYYDRSIYSKDRLIRTVRSDKCFSGRPFRLVFPRPPYDETLTFVSVPMCKGIAAHPSLASPPLQDQDLSLASPPLQDQDLSLASPRWKAPPTELHRLLHRYHLSSCFRAGSELHPGVFRLHRTQPSLCRICDRVHEHENAWIDTLKWRYGCYRAGETSVPLDSDVLVVSRARLVRQLQTYALTETEIDALISRSKPF